MQNFKHFLFVDLLKIFERNVTVFFFTKLSDLLLTMKILQCVAKNDLHHRLQIATVGIILTSAAVSFHHKILLFHYLGLLGSRYWFRVYDHIVVKVDALTHFFYYFCHLEEPILHKNGSVINLFLY